MDKLASFELALDSGFGPEVTKGWLRKTISDSRGGNHEPRQITYSLCYTRSEFQSAKVI